MGDYLCKLGKDHCLLVDYYNDAVDRHNELLDKYMKLKKGDTQGASDMEMERLEVDQKRGCTQVPSDLEKKQQEGNRKSSEQASEEAEEWSTETTAPLLQSTDDDDSFSFSKGEEEVLGKDII